LEESAETLKNFKSELNSMINWIEHLHLDLLRQQTLSISGNSIITTSESSSTITSNNQSPISSKASTPSPSQSFNSLQNSDSDVSLTSFFFHLTYLLFLFTKMKKKYKHYVIILFYL
jgi:hypothetical protein